MTDTTAPLHELVRNEFELPSGAPVVRITAGVGSANQKTWNVRRPVTLIGSCRPAHIVLHDRDISKAHCVIVNTGTDVLLKDLCTSSGTFVGKDRVDLVALDDGDVLTIGGTKLQIAISLPDSEQGNDDSACGITFEDPTQFPKPLTVRLDASTETWRIEDAVVLVGRHNSAGLRLDHVDVSTRHAVIFRFDGGPAIFDLGSRTGIMVNGGRCGQANLRAGDRVGIGPCTLAVGVMDPPSATLSPANENPSPGAENAPSTPGPGWTTTDLPQVPRMPTERRDGTGATASPASPATAGSPVAPDAPMKRASHPALTQLESELNALQRNIGDSWGRLNQWQERLREDAVKLSKQDSDLALRETEIDTKDAALRGQLHDLTCYHEQITTRERELAEQLARVQTEQDKLLALQADIIRREGDVARRNDELQRREHVLAQRWARLLSANCPHCGKPVRPGGEATP